MTLLTRQFTFCKLCWPHPSDAAGRARLKDRASGVESILKLYLSKSIVTDGKTTQSKVESID